MTAGPCRIAQELRSKVEGLRFGPPVAFVYDPLAYAWEAHRQYIERYGNGPRRVLLLGMNPGPWGMAQTGVPFGEVSIVRDWLRIDAPIGKPEPEHPKRPVEGLACPRAEVSGARLWGWARDRFGAPEAFFERFFVLNYCPLAFMEAGGKNRTPDKLPPDEREPLFAACDEALRGMVRYYAPRVVVGVGAFAAARAAQALRGTGVEVATIIHPSPANPRANRGWAKEAGSILERLGGC